MCEPAKLKASSQCRRIQVERRPYLVLVVEHEIEDAEVNAPFRIQTNEKGIIRDRIGQAKESDINKVHDSEFITLPLDWNKRKTLQQMTHMEQSNRAVSD